MKTPGILIADASMEIFSMTRAMAVGIEKVRAKLSEASASLDSEVPAHAEALAGIAAVSDKLKMIERAANDCELEISGAILAFRPAKQPAPDHG